MYWNATTENLLENPILERTTINCHVGLSKGNNKFYIDVYPVFAEYFVF